jgi:shikimate kinase
MKPPSHVLITGFMGSGKSTVAAALARALGYPVIDLDDHIAEREGRTAQIIIDQEGENSFREVETRALQDALERRTESVIALGGGAWTLDRNRALAARYGGFSVWLDAPFELCWRRIGNQSAVRPFARDIERARLLYEERRTAYGLAGLRIEVSPEQKAEELAAEIEGALRL